MDQDDHSESSGTALVAKILQVLEVLKGSGAGAVLYRQVQQLLGSLDDQHLETERVYAGLLYSMLDAYIQHLPAGSTMYTRARLLQQRLQPPLSRGDYELLRAEMDLCVDHIVQLPAVGEEALRQALAPFLLPESAEREGCEVPQHGVPASVAHDGGGPAGERRRDARRLRDALSEEIRQTISQNEEFGVMLEVVAGELQHAVTYENLEMVRKHLLEQVKGLRQGHYALAEKLDSTERYLDLMQMDSAHLDEELSRVRMLSLTDELTQLPNRRAFVNRLEDEVARARRFELPLALAMVDLDWFKAVNDRYGHAVGDEVLRCYADKVFAVFRHQDMVSRYGGEEFAVLMPSTGEEGALCALDKVRERAETLALRPNGQELKLPSFSAGLALYREDETPTGFIHRADAALYRAKHQGRDRVEVAGAEEFGGALSDSDTRSGSDAESRRPTSRTLQ